jgi:hypothetical protein
VSPVVAGDFSEPAEPVVEALTAAFLSNSTFALAGVTSQSVFVPVVISASVQRSEIPATASVAAGADPPGGVGGKHHPVEAMSMIAIMSINFFIVSS